MNIIHILDETTANKIAAGEVVERPASVIKELVENSIDAQSTNIEIEIADGGVSFIRITDNGIGMTHEDAQIAILRHATSKICSADDLYDIHSLGFRGEALPSIAAVSRFQLTTRQRDVAMATLVEVHGGILQEVREAGANTGTTIVVKDLFFNTPARKKFLKSLTTESSHIHDVLTKLALSYPHVAFKLLNGNRLVLSTPGNGQLSDTLASLYGQKIIPDLLAVNYGNEEDGIYINGYLAKPTLLKSSRMWQTFILNDRVIANRAIAKALDNAYHSLLPKSGYPLAVLHLSVPRGTIDVNVHPQKSEVKFSDEQKIFRAVYKAVTGVLSTSHAPSQLAATVEFKHNGHEAAIYHKPVFTSSPIPAYGTAQEETAAQLEPIRWREEPLSFIVEQAANHPQKEEVLLPASSFQTMDQDTTGDSECAAVALQPLGQVDNCYIITKGCDGLYIIDQHAAHERILYDKLNQYQDRIPSQQLLVPIFLDFDQREMDLITRHENTFHYLGFGLDMAGPTTMRLRELPTDIPVAEAENFIGQILQSIENSENTTPQQLRHSCMQMAACRAAIKAGELLNMRQMQALVNELMNTTLPYTCPHGRPAIVRFSPMDLAKLFKRT